MAQLDGNEMTVPFFRPDLAEQEIREVTDTLRSGWLTTGPKTQQFEEQFAAAVGARHAVAVSSCTAALHLAMEALGLRRGQGVLVPTMTFAASAEVVRYSGAVPILVDCESETLNLDLEAARDRIGEIRSGRLEAQLGTAATPTGVVPVHVGGIPIENDRLREFAKTEQLWIVEDAAHAFPA